MAQAQRRSEAQPSHEPIRIKRLSAEEIVDSPEGTTRIKKAINLFDYPKGTITYVVNGRTTKSVRYVKRQLSGKEITRLSIGNPDINGKRVIDITYE
ncbi:hypothetical protein GCM10023189_09730 [Nibrella saemangeumensis]|uniref:Uncharacterized protein n=1 Tax=Nibrella saemangeumensis TaxID=1084526 RepID=A0ABP8MI32_9BACT